MCASFTFRFALLFSALFLGVLSGVEQAHSQSVFENEFSSWQDFACSELTYKNWIRLDRENNLTSFELRNAEGQLEKSVVCEKNILREKTTYLSGRPWRSQTIYRTVPTLALVVTLTYFSESVTQNEKVELFRHLADSNLETKPRLLRRWIYQIGSDVKNSLEQVDVYNEKYQDTAPNSPGNIIERFLYSPTGEESIYRFEYANDETLTVDRMGRTPELRGFEKLASTLSPGIRYSESQLLGLELFQQDLSAPTVAILDGGVDIWSAEFRGKIWKNQNEEQNGIDDDMNGLIDDVVGFTDNPRTHRLPIPDVRLPRAGAPAKSHGTLIASIIAKDNDNVAIAPIAEVGEMNSPDFYASAEKFVNSNRIRFTNLSFSIDQDLFAEIGDSTNDRSRDLIQYITKTPETLHIAAAGNGNIFTGKGKNLNTEVPGRVLPAMLVKPNLLVVGALQTSELSPDLMPSYQMSTFSNYGDKYVDILAPGENICGADLGGGSYCESGTSFSAPFVIAKIILPMLKVNPQLSNVEIKEIILKTAYIPDLEKPLPVRSGGMINPLRALEVAKLKLSNPTLIIQELALEARTQGAGQIDGESSSPEYLEKLKELWRQRAM